MDGWMEREKDYNEHEVTDPVLLPLTLLHLPRPLFSSPVFLLSVGLLWLY